RIAVLVERRAYLCGGEAVHERPHRTTSTSERRRCVVRRYSRNVVDVQRTARSSLLGCDESSHRKDAKSAQVSPHTQCMRAWLRRWSSQTGQSSLTRPTSNGRVAQYNTYDARTFFSDLLRRVRAGEEIVIAHAGNPIAKLVPYRRPIETRPGIVRMTVVVNDATAASEPAQ